MTFNGGRVVCLWAREVHNWTEIY